jgi:HAE1 family hydrophobic/amphiphilic exporter-1
MNLIRTAIDRPIAVVAAVLMVVMFGLVALENIPIQLAPDVNRPVITIKTNWPGAAPAEVEREITNRQEEEMAGLEGLREITGRAEQGRSRVTLEFAVGTNMDRAAKTARSPGSSSAVPRATSGRCTSSATSWKTSFKTASSESRA